MTILAFNGTMVSYLSIFLTDNRWIFLLLLSIQQIFSKQRQHTPRFFMICLFLYALWCIITVSWSENNELSFMKSSMFFILTFTMIRAGQFWMARSTLRKSFDYLIPLAIVAYATGILGYFFSPNAFDGILFQGYVYGANMFGALMAMTIPLILWRCYLNLSRPHIRNIWIGLLLLAMLFIFMSMSRAALLMALLSLAGGLVFLAANKQLLFGYLIIAVAILVYSFSPIFGSQVVQRVVYKHGDTVLYTRVQVWDESYEKATLGGWFGAGYGVSIGAPAIERERLTSVGYGREKGNSQLAIIEETGIVGFLLYILMLASLFRILLRKYKKTKSRDIKVALGLYIGALAGMIVQSGFEAWWVAPGAPESAVFWALAGCALGLTALDDKIPHTSNLRQTKQ